LGYITRLTDSLHKRLRIQRKQSLASAVRNAAWDPKTPIHRSALCQAGFTADKVLLVGEAITGSTVLTDTGGRAHAEKHVWKAKQDVSGPCTAWARPSSNLSHQLSAAALSASPQPGVPSIRKAAAHLPGKRKKYPALCH